MEQRFLIKCGVLPNDNLLLAIIRRMDLDADAKLNLKEFIDGHSNHVDATFSHWKTRHSKQYTDQNETNMRKDIYRQNMRYIHSTNRQHLTYNLASNHLADLTDSEMKFRRGKLKSSGNNGGLDFRYSRQELNGAPESLGKKKGISSNTGVS